MKQLKTHHSTPDHEYAFMQISLKDNMDGISTKWGNDNDNKLFCFKLILFAMSNFEENQFIIWILAIKADPNDSRNLLFLKENLQ